MKKMIIFVLMISCAMSLSGCLKNSPLEPERLFYLKAGEPAPISGWLIEESLAHDIFLDALKGRTK